MSVSLCRPCGREHLACRGDEVIHPLQSYSISLAVASATEEKVVVSLETINSAKDEIRIEKRTTAVESKIDFLHRCVRCIAHLAK